MPAARPSPDLDATLLALADPVRRGVVELLKARPHRAGELAAALGTNGPSMSKHLKMLRAGALIEAQRPTHDARVRVYRLRPERFDELRDWLEDVRGFWSDQLGAFKQAADVAAKRQRSRDSKRRKHV